MRNLIVLAIAGALMYGCSNSAPKPETAAAPAQNLIEITNDMENATAVIPSWINEKTVMAMTNPPAHSGEFACVTNDTIEYSYAFQELLKNVNTGIPKKIVVTGWVYTTVASPKLGLIMNISENQQQYNWKVYPLTETLTETGKWVEFTANYYFTDKPLSPEHEIRIFAWNQSKKPIYFDDFKISFEY